MVKSIILKTSSRYILAALITCCATACLSNNFAFAKEALTITKLSSDNIILDKLGRRLFPVLSSLKRNAIDADAIKILEVRQGRIDACIDADCKLKAAIWNDNEIDAIVRAFPAPTNANYNNKKQSIKNEIAGINGIIQVYGLGQEPKYPKIDGPEKNDPKQYALDVAASVEMARMVAKERISSFDPSIAIALSLLDGADRLEVVEMDRLYEEYNQPIIEAASNTDWAKYKYSAIVVLGIGPERPELELSAGGRLNVQNAAKSYIAGLAPYIIVTGGHVHPRRTKFVEAIEMREALIERYNIPASAILIDPHARHTTTNMRNVSRILIKMGIPYNKEGIILSVPQHSSYVEGKSYYDRNISELGYMPVTIGKRISPYEVTFRINKESESIDPRDPLDP